MAYWLYFLIVVLAKYGPFQPGRILKVQSAFFLQQMPKRAGVSSFYLLERRSTVFNKFLKNKKRNYFKFLFC